MLEFVLLALSFVPQYRVCWIALETEYTQCGSWTSEPVVRAVLKATSACGPNSGISCWAEKAEMPVPADKP